MSTMQAAWQDSTYDRTSIRLHWATAVLVVLLWCLGETIDWFPRDLPRIFARSTHITLGATLAIVLCWRIWWRSTTGARLPPVGGWLGIASRLVHYALYALLVTVVALGIANAWIRGDNLFNLFHIPAFDPGNRVLRKQVEDLHGLWANVLLIVAGVHAAAALVHRYVFRDAVLQRMWAWRR